MVSLVEEEGSSVEVVRTLELSSSDEVSVSDTTVRELLLDEGELEVVSSSVEVDRVEVGDTSTTGELPDSLSCSLDELEDDSLLSVMELEDEDASLEELDGEAELLSSSLLDELLRELLLEGTTEEEDEVLSDASFC